MKALASFIMRGPMQAVMVVTLTSALSILLSPVQLVTAGAVALVTLRNGWRSGLLVVAGGAAAAGLLGYFATPNHALVAGFLVSMAVVVVPVWLLAIVLRATIALGLAVALASLVGALFVFGMHGAVGDPAAVWRGVFEQALAANPALGGDADQFGAVVETMAGLMTGLLAAALVTTSVLGLFLGRWWQALLYNPGGFRDEFLGLDLGRTAAIVAIVVAVAAKLFEGGIGAIAGDLTWVVTTVYVFVGAAIFHHIAAAKGWGRGPVVAFYFAMIIPHLVFLVAVVGWVDTWAKFRGRFPLPSQPGASKAE